MARIPSFKAVEFIRESAGLQKLKQSHVDDFLNKYRDGIDDPGVVLKDVLANAERKALNSGNNAKLFQEHTAKMDTYDSGSTYMANLAEAAFNGKREEVNIAKRSQSIAGYLRRNTVEFDEGLSTRVQKLLRFDQAAQDDFVNSILEPGTYQPKLKESTQRAQSVTDMLDEALTMFNDVGGGMKRLEGKKGQYLPQAHDTQKMLFVPNEMRSKDIPTDPNVKVSKKFKKKSLLEQDHEIAKSRWVGYVKGKLNYERMGMNGLNDAQIDEVLGNSFEQIVSNGMYKVKQEANPVDFDKYTAKPSLANTRQQARELHFKSAKDWIEYKDSYGNPDVYKTVIDYVDGMSRDIASMQVLGTNPDRMWEKLKEYAKTKEKLTGFEGHLDGMYKVATGKADSMAGSTQAQRNTASIGGFFRSLGVATDLGSAVISSVTDTVTSGMAAGFRGMNPLHTFYSQMGTVMRRIGAGMKVSEKEKFAARIGIVSDQFTASIRNNRFSEGGGWKPMQKVAEGVIRASGLSAWTNALRNTFSMELTGLLADNVGKSLDSFTMGKALRDSYGITEADWAKINKTHVTKFESGGFLDTTALYQTDPALALRLLDVINTEANYAIILPDARIRSIVTGGGQQKGTGLGEGVRTLAMYKSFPIAMAAMQLGRWLSIETKQGKAAYAGAMIIGVTGMGMVALQIKEGIKGKTAVPLNDEKSWGRAFMQGGALGIMGDFFFSSQSRYGGDFASTFLLGKAAQPFTDYAAIKDAALNITEDEKDPTAMLTKKAMNYIPGRNLWYARLILDRTIFDTIKEATDPEYRTKNRRTKMKMKEETGQGYWAPPPGAEPAKPFFSTITK